MIPSPNHETFNGCSRVECLVNVKRDPVRGNLVAAFHGRRRWSRSGSPTIARTFDLRRSALNEVWRFSGYSLGEDGKLRVACRRTDA